MKKIDVPTTAEVEHRFAEHPYLAESGEDTAYGSEAARFRAWLAEHDRTLIQKVKDLVEEPAEDDEHRKSIQIGISQAIAALEGRN